MQEVSVSVVMSEYNTEEEYLKESIESILNQTFKEFEFIIISDGSKNDIEEIVKSYNDSRIVVINNEKNMGLPASLNKGIQAARGKYIARMDADDICPPDRLEKQMNFIKQNPQYDFVGMNALFFDENGVYGKSSYEGEITKKDLMYGNCFMHPTMFIKKQALIDLGGYSLVNRCEDYELWCRAICNGYKMFIMKDIGFSYRVREKDYSKRTLKNRKDIIKVKMWYLNTINAPKRYYYIILKEILAGILPAKLMKYYHSKKFKIKE